MANYLLDAAQFDLTKVMFGPDALERANPQRGDMRQLDGVCWAGFHGQFMVAVGFKDCRQDEFWVPGHIPGRPLLPGVLMIEAAAQLAAFMIKEFRKEPGFLGFVGCDQVKFRGQVTPGQRLYIFGKEIEYRPGRRFVCQTQGVCDDKLVFEATIKGMAI